MTHHDVINCKSVPPAYDLIVTRPPLLSRYYIQVMFAPIVFIFLISTMMVGILASEFSTIRYPKTKNDTYRLYIYFSNTGIYKIRIFCNYFCSINGLLLALAIIMYCVHYPGSTN